jgi:hypothetical protein
MQTCKLLEISSFRGLKFLGIDPSQLRVVHPKVTLMETSSGLPDEPENPVRAIRSGETRLARGFQASVR